MSTVYSVGGKSSSNYGARNYTSPKSDEYKRHEDNARVRDIANKWNNIRENIDRNRGQKLQAIDDYVNNLEKRINEVTNDPLAKKIKKVIGEIQEDIAKEQLELEQLEERQVKAISSIDDSCKQIVDELRNSQRTWMKELDTQIDDRFYTLNHTIAKNKKGNDEKTEKEISEISGAIADIKDAVESEKVQRESGSEQIVQKIQLELEKLEEDIVIDQKVREETSARLKNLIVEINSNLMRDIETERKERETMNGSLLNLLEDACSKIERNFASNYL